MNNEAFLRDLQRRGINPYVWNGCVKWSDPSSVLSKPEKRRLRRLRYAVAAMRANDSAGPDVSAGIDPRFDIPPAAHWSWKPPRRPDPGKLIYSRTSGKRQRSEATKAQPRADDGQFGKTGTPTDSGQTRDQGRSKTAEAKAAASGTNRGAVERKGKPVFRRPKGLSAPPDEAWWERTLGRRFEQLMEDAS